MRRLLIFLRWFGKKLGKDWFDQPAPEDLSTFKFPVGLSIALANSRPDTTLRRELEAEFHYYHHVLNEVKELPDRELERIVDNHEGDNWRVGRAAAELWMRRYGNQGGGA